MEVHKSNDPLAQFRLAQEYRTLIAASDQPVQCIKLASRQTQAAAKRRRLGKLDRIGQIREDSRIELIVFTNHWRGNTELEGAF
jgi:chromosome segregation and condensation protein ScpB